MTAARLEGAQFGKIRAQLLLYPLVQMDEDLWAEDWMKQTRMIGWAATRYITTQLASPDFPSLLSLGQRSSAITIIASGGVLDPCRIDAISLADSLQKSELPLLFCEYPSLIHGFGNFTHTSEAARLAVQELGELTGKAVRRLR